jgi:ATP-dependent RNA helicase DeaD
MNLFEQSTLDSKILRAITDLGFSEPTPIQDKTIPLILESEDDLIALAQTGTGKTAGFGLPILQQIDTSLKTVQAIVLSPTRELAMQIAKDLENYSKYLFGVRIVSVYGGAAINNQIRDLKKGAHIVVGTPGRTLDLIKRKALKINNIRWLVLDEADEMLNMGFREELDAILETTPDEKQTLLFSATMPDGVRHIAQNYLHKPNEISVGKKNSGAQNVNHEYYVVRSSDRYLALKRIADFNTDIYAIIFCRTRAETKDIAAKLIDDGYNADALHGDLSQAQRDYVMQRFRTRQLQLLVATDVAARGLDINDLTHVINYNLPDDPEVYIHRSGRTGRAGKTGISIIISHSREASKIRAIENLVGKKFEYKQIPSGNQICENRLYKLIDKIKHIEVDEEKINPYLPTIIEKLGDLDKDELLKRIVYVEFERFLEYYKNDKNINVERSNRNTKDKKQKNKKDNPEKRHSRKNYTRLFVNIGTKQHVNPNKLMGLINELTDSNNIGIGKIDIQRNFSFFEVEKGNEQIIIDSFFGKNFGSKKLIIEVSNMKKNNTAKKERYGNRKKHFSQYK